MANMLDKFKEKISGTAPKKSGVTVYTSGPLAKPINRPVAPESALPHAAAIYGAAAAIFAVLTFYYLIKGHWFTGTVMILPTLCLGGFAYHHLKN